MNFEECTSAAERCTHSGVWRSSIAFSSAPMTSKCFQLRSWKVVASGSAVTGGSVMCGHEQ